MMRLLVIILSLVVGWIADAQALQTCGTNARWLCDSSGKAVYLSVTSGGGIGASFFAIQDITFNSTPVTYDSHALILDAKARGFNAIRMWLIEQGDWTFTHSDWANNLYARIPFGAHQFPYLQVSTRVDSSSGTNITVGVFNLAAYDDLFFSRVKSRTDDMLAQGLYPIIMLNSTGYHGYAGIEGSGFSSPFFGGNNVNGVSADTNSNSLVEEVATLVNPTITAFQDGLLCKWVDTFKTDADVIFEMDNEGQGDYTAWYNHQMDTLRACEASLGSVRHVIVLSPYNFGSGGFVTNNHLFSNARPDFIVVSCFAGLDYENNPPMNQGSFHPVGYDTDHANSFCDGIATVELPWKLALRSIYGWWLQERESASVAAAIERAIRQLTSYLARLDLVNMVADGATATETFPSTAIVDTANRANEGPPPTGWVNSYGSGIKIVSNEFQPNAYGGDHASTWNTSKNADQQWYARIGSGWPSNETGTICVHLRVQTANDLNSDNYSVCATPRTGNDVLEVFKKVSSVDTKLGGDIPLGREFSSSDLFGGSIRGDTISIFVNGTVLDTRVDSSITGAGYGALAFYSVTSGAIDEFGGGNLSALGSTICSTGYCLRKDGVQYLLYRVSGSTNPTIDLTAYPNVTFLVEHFNPATGLATQQANVSGGAVRTFTIGWTGEAVVYLTSTPPGPTVVQATGLCYGDNNAPAVCTFPNTPTVGNKIVVMVAMQQYPFTQPCSISRVLSDPHGQLYDLAVEGPVQGASQASIWVRDIQQATSGSFPISLTCNAPGANTFLVMGAVEISGAVPNYSALESPGWAGGTNPSSVTVQSFQPTSQNNALALAVLSLNFPNVTIGTQSGWTERFNNGDQTGGHGGGAGATLPLTAVTTPSHTWTITCVSCSGDDHAQAVIAVIRGVQAAPPPPGGGPGTINRSLRWTDNATNEVTYRVRKRTDQTYPNWVDVATNLPPNTVTYTATILDTETGDCWEVAAVNPYGIGSLEGCALPANQPPPPPPPPIGIQIGQWNALLDEELL